LFDCWTLKTNLPLRITFVSSFDLITWLRPKYTMLQKHRVRTCRNIKIDFNVDYFFILFLIVIHGFALSCCLLQNTEVNITNGMISSFVGILRKARLHVLCLYCCICILLRNDSAYNPYVVSPIVLDKNDILPFYFLYKLLKK
jgi:hypothetical protein